MTRSISVRDARKRSDEVRISVIEISLKDSEHGTWTKGTGKTPAKIVYSKRFSARASGPPCHGNDTPNKAFREKGAMISGGTNTGHHLHTTQT
jgi:hypothetical protein